MPLAAHLLFRCDALLFVTTAKSGIMPRFDAMNGGNGRCLPIISMSESENLPPSGADAEKPLRRCPNCDTVVNVSATQCLMCGEMLPAAPEPTPDPAPAVAAVPEPTAVGPEAEEPLMEPDETPVVAAPPVSAARAGKPAALPPKAPKARRWPATGVQVLTAVFTLILIVIAILILRFQSPHTAVALFPSVTPIPPTPSATPTWTPWPSETPRPSATPTITFTPAPTDTPQPPQNHRVASGETLIGLSLRYRVSPESIADANGFSVDMPIQVDQTLLIPWPTATPPLVPVAEEINGEVVIADPTDCQRYEVQLGDSLSGIAARFDVDFGLFLRVNRLTDEYILQRGDTLCIPEIVYGGSLPPTPGPSPMPSPTAPLPGPNLLYPVDGITIDPPDAPFLLQWVAVKDLGAEEWYMVEVRNLSVPDHPPMRTFTRDTAVRVPLNWRPQVAEMQLFRWRVSIVQVTGERADGQFIYTYGGETSPQSTFYWLGAVPTPTPTATPTSTSTSIPNSD